MKTLLLFLKTTITGGVLFLIPVALIVIVIGKVFRLLRPLVQRAVILLQVETAMGVLALTLVTSFILLVICFAAGLLIRFGRMKRLRKFTEDLILKFVPGFEYVKAMAGHDDRGDPRSTLTAILLWDEDAWVIAFIVEQAPTGYTTVFIPESPRVDSGNSKMLLTASLTYHEITMREAMSCLRHYGAGLVFLLGKKQSLESAGASVKPATN